jgi:ABC-type branched-chain amino acid transport systems, ATPase component
MSTHAGPPVLEIRHLTVSFGGLTALADVSLSLDGDQAIWGLVGPNGSGKTTLFNCVSGMIRPTGGQILVNGRPLRTGSPRAASRLGIGRTFQSPRLFERMSVLDNLLAASRGERRPTQRAEELLELVEMTAHRRALAGQLSIGQKKLVELARVLMRRPAVVLLDEIAAGVHPRMVERIEGYLRTLRAQGVRFFLVEHDVEMVARLCERLFVLDRGRLIAEGPCQEVLRDPQVVSAYLGRPAGPAAEGARDAA